MSGTGATGAAMLLALIGALALLVAQSWRSGYMVGRDIAQRDAASRWR